MDVVKKDMQRVCVSEEDVRWKKIIQMVADDPKEKQRVTLGLHQTLVDSLKFH